MANMTQALGMIETKVLLSVHVIPRPDGSVETILPGTQA